MRLGSKDRNPKDSRLLSFLASCQSSSLDQKEMEVLEKVLSELYHPLMWKFIRDKRVSAPLCRLKEVSCVRVQGVWRVAEIVTKDYTDSWIVAYACKNISASHLGPQAYLLRANATAVRSKLALWGLPSLLVRVLHLHWTWAGHVLRMGASSFQHRAALLGAHSWRWLEAVAQDTDPANLQCWRHPRAGRRCLTWDFWLERFLPELDWAPRAADRHGWHSLAPRFVAMVLHALRQPVPDLRPLHGGMHLTQPHLSTDLLAPACNVAILQRVFARLRRPLRPRRCQVFVAGDSAVVSKWIAGEAQFDAASPLVPLVRAAHDMFLSLFQSGAEFRDFQASDSLRLVSHIPRLHNQAADALANRGADGCTLEQFDSEAASTLLQQPCTVLVTFGGAARDNPVGHAGAGTALCLSFPDPALGVLSWKCVAQASAYLGVASSNAAELHGLLLVLLLLGKLLTWTVDVRCVAISVCYAGWVCEDSEFAAIGRIPEELGELLWLQVIDLTAGLCGKASLQGPVPESLGQLLQLRKLILANNQLTGALPASLFQLRQLTVLNLAGNKLSGQLGDIGSLTQLQVLSLENNAFSGPLATSFGRLLQLKELNLAGNALTGNVIGELGQMSQLKTLSLANNVLKGHLPESLGNLQQLTKLELQGNDFWEPLPESLGRLTKLKTLRVNVSTVPFTLRRLTELHDFFLNGQSNCAPVINDNCQLFENGQGCQKDEEELMTKIMQSLWGSNYELYSRRLEGCPCFWYGVSCVRENGFLRVWGLNIEDGLFSCGRTCKPTLRVSGLRC
ncbi:RLP12 [Symbiodinium microadriaticum]|nr:RLP12 [Symbiodinium microadriaticum]